MNSQNSHKSFKAGDIIMKQGDEGRCAYIIEEGLVEILIEKPDGQTLNVGTRGEGSIIGEMALVDAAPRTATVKAVRDCSMLEITSEDFSQRLKTTDPVVQMISQVILTRYRDTLTRADILRDDLTYPPPEAIEKTFAEQADVVESVKIANELRSALDKDELEMHFQPIINLSGGHITGFEALMRWPHPEQGFISPGLFIPIAEKSGLIVDASKWALRQSCLGLKRIQEATGRDDLYVSVNFSSHDFAEPDFVHNITDTIKDCNVAPDKIVLEITERLLIQQPDNAKDTLLACHDEGVRIAIDDFGTGYSSLSYLYYFPIDILKIDQSFIRAMYREERSLELVKSIVALATNLNLLCVAEGVEDIEEARLLQGMGCESAQGFYFARPMPEENIVTLMTGWEPVKVSA